MSHETFGQWLASKRKGEKLTQGELAERLGGSTTFRDVNELEHDRTDPRDPHLLRKLSDILCVGNEELESRVSRHDEDRLFREAVRRSTEDALLAFRRERRDV